MKNVFSFLLKVIVQQFYIINTGFFLFFFFIFFGVVNGGQLISYHLSLILGMLSSPVFLLVVFAGWLLYNIKCMAFYTTAIQAAESTYLFSLKALSPAKQLIIYFIISTLLYLPVILYSGFVIIIAFKKNLWMTGLVVLAYQLLMISLNTLVFYAGINSNNILSSYKKITGAITKLYSFPYRYSTYLLGHIFNSRKMAFGAVKVFSLLLLSVSFIRNGDHFDADFFSIFFQLILTGHAVLVFYCVSFNESYLHFSRNLPLAIYKVGGMYLLTFCILLLPELLFMLINNHGNLPVALIVELYLTAIVTLFFYTATLYACGLNMERLMLFVFVSFIIIFFLQKTGEQLLLMLGVLLAAAMVFKTHYFSFEKELT